jgi:hypothetical protein
MSLDTIFLMLAFVPCTFFALAVGTFWLWIYLRKQ